MSKERKEGKVNSINQIAHTQGGKVLIGIWVLILIILIGFAIVGYIKNEFIGYVFASFFPTAILADISIIISYKTEKKGFHLTKAGWYFLSIVVIFSPLIIPIIDPQKANNYFAAGIFIIYPMIALSFPSGFLFVYIYGGLSYLFDSLGLSSFLDFGKMNFYIVNFILWLGFFIVGYLQWFKLLPHLIEWWKSKRSHKLPA